MRHMPENMSAVITLVLQVGNRQGTVSGYAAPTGAKVTTQPDRAHSITRTEINMVMVVV